MQEFDLADIAPKLQKVLLIGMEGSGKTHFIGTMPKPIFLFSLDKGMNTLAGQDGIRTCLILEEDRRKPTAYKDFKERFDKLLKGEKYKWADGREEPFKTIAIDPVTCLSTMIFDHYQYINSNMDKKATFTEYQMVKSTTQDVLNKCVKAAENVIVTAMVMTDKDELTGEIFFLADMIGSIRDEIGMWFDAVFYMQADKNMDGRVVYHAITVGSRRHRAKLRIPSNIKAGILPAEEPDFGVITKKINDAFAKMKGEQASVQVPKNA